MTVSLLLWFWAVPAGLWADADPNSLEAVQQLTENLQTDPSQTLDSFWTGSGGAASGAGPMPQPVPLSTAQTQPLPLTATMEATADAPQNPLEVRAHAEDFRALLSMSGEELDLLFAESPAGPIPDGDSEGIALPFSGTLIGRFLSWLFSLFWQGKVFGGLHRSQLARLQGIGHRGLLGNLVGGLHDPG